MRPSEALALHREEVLAILAKYPVSNPRIFGSVARGEDVEGSDLDLLVDEQNTVSTFDLARLEIELEVTLKTPVDVKTPGDFPDEVSRRVESDLQPL